MKPYQKLFKENKIPKAPAYWIDPSGHILPIFDNEKHIDQIMSKPEAFGIDKDEIKRIYDIENEPLGSEGVAREKIIKNLIGQGWIRIRYYIRQDMFTVNINKLSKKNKDYIYSWAKEMKEYNLDFSQAIIDMPGSVLKYSIRDLVNDILFNESKNINHLKVVKNVQDLPNKITVSILK